MRNFSFENEFHCRVRMSFSYDRISTITHSENEARSNSEMVDCSLTTTLNTFFSIFC